MIEVTPRYEFALTYVPKVGCLSDDETPHDQRKVVVVPTTRGIRFTYETNAKPGWLEYICCCLCSAPKPSLDILDLYQTGLASRYSDTAARLAQRITGIDLAAKKAMGSFLTVVEAVTLKEVAKEWMATEERIKIMMRQMKYYTLFLRADEVTPASQSRVVEVRDTYELIVKKKNEFHRFSDKKLRETIQSIASPTLSAETINAIIATIKKTIINHHPSQKEIIVDAEKITELVVKEFRYRVLDIPKPVAYEQVSTKKSINLPYFNQTDDDLLNWYKALKGVALVQDDVKRDT